MDLAMILSPAGGDDDDALPAPPATVTVAVQAPSASPGRKWSADEVECAVAILHDFQLPGGQSADASAPSTGVWGASDAMSKLDLLVQADAAIASSPPRKRSRSRSRSRSPSPDHGEAPRLRSGVWTRAEEEYAAALMVYFLNGALEDVAEGTTLRKFLAERLRCNRRRVSMKLATEAIAQRKIPRKVGASVFVALEPRPSAQERDETRATLATLRRRCFATRSLSAERDHQQDEPIEHKPATRHPRSRAADHHHHQQHTNRRSTAASASSAGHGKPTIIRTGFESPEEDEYVTTMVDFFLQGALDLPDGTRLVTYLCSQLGCSPRELSLKLAPRRLGERKFPDNVGSLTYIRRQPEDSTASLSDAEDGGMSDELFEIESRLRELRVACLDAHAHLPPPPARVASSSSAASSSSQAGGSPLPTQRGKSPTSSPSRSFSRSGPWSRAEEAYTAALIDCFFKGALELPEGTTLRAFLAARLRCNPMRVSKKLASECIADVKIPKKLGSSTFVRRGAVGRRELAEADAALRKLQLAHLHADATTGRVSAAGYYPRRPRHAVRPPLSYSDQEDDEAASVGSTGSAKRLKTEFKTEFKREFDRSPDASESPKLEPPRLVLA